MGWPAVIGLALTAAGTGMQMSASAQERNRMEQATRDELARQSRYQNQASGEFARSLKQADRPTANKQMAEGTSKLADIMQRVQATPITEPSVPTTAPMRIDPGGPQRLETQRSNQARAQLGGLSEWQLDQMINDIRARQQLGIISSNAGMSSRVLPLELQHAQQSAEGLRGAGSLMSSVGGVAGMYGSMANAGATASGATAPPAGTINTPYASYPPGYTGPLYNQPQFNWNSAYRI